MYQQYLDKAKVKLILLKVSENDGQLGWYNIEIYLGALELGSDPLPYAVAKALIEAGCLRFEVPEGETHGRYYITNDGRKLLQMLLALE